MYGLRQLCCFPIPRAPQCSCGWSQKYFGENVNNPLFKQIDFKSSHYKILDRMFQIETRIRARSDPDRLKPRVGLRKQPPAAAAAPPRPLLALPRSAAAAAAGRTPHHHRGMIMSRQPPRRTAGPGASRQAVTGTQ
jgi:hypothetical protein